LSFKSTCQVTEVWESALFNSYLNGYVETGLPKSTQNGAKKYFSNKIEHATGHIAPLLWQNLLIQE